MKSDVGSVKRKAKIILGLHAGKKIQEIAEEVGLSKSGVYYWRRAFLERGLEIFNLTRGRKPKLDNLESQGEQKKGQFYPKKGGSTQGESVDFPSPMASPGIQADEPVWEAGRKILRFHFAEMLKYEKRVRTGEDVEDLHDMRVAVRRMRTALDLFSEYYDEKYVKVFKKGLRSIGKVLGAVRDYDVFLLKTEKYLDTISLERSSNSEMLLDIWGQQRGKARKRLLKYLRKDPYKLFKEEFNLFVNTPGLYNSEIANQPERISVRNAAPAMINKQFLSVCSYNGKIGGATIEEYHALRISLKKFRYCIEFFREVLGSTSKLVIRDIKILQDHLGDLNDAEVACKALQKIIKKLEKFKEIKSIDQTKGTTFILEYLNARLDEKRRLMETFPEVWAHFLRSEFHKNLENAVVIL